MCVCVRVSLCKCVYAWVCVCERECVTAVPRAVLSCAHARSWYPDIYTATSYRNHELDC